MADRPKSVQGVLDQIEWHRAVIAECMDAGEEYAAEAASAERSMRSAQLALRAMLGPRTAGVWVTLLSPAAGPGQMEFVHCLAEDAAPLLAAGWTVAVG